MTDEERPIEVAEPTSLDAKRAEKAADARAEAFFDLEAVPRMPDDALKLLARQVVTDLVYLTDKPEGLRAFDPILRVAAPLMKPSYQAEVRGVYEFYSKSQPHEVGTPPVFTSMQVVAAADWPRLIELIGEVETELGISKPLTQLPNRATRRAKKRSDA